MKKRNFREGPRTTVHETTGQQDHRTTDSRWHLGGWTSHFEWETQPQTTTLDIFGRAVRQSSPWEHDVEGLYAGRNVVAEMKRTDRDKDWPFITSLGTDMLRADDQRGWLHLFDARNNTAALVQPELLGWLPNVRSYFWDGRACCPSALRGICES